ncbi:hypothetical protein R3P38DRAFT_1329480 [Favolaschia claudopus]|uniref:Secreted protein n=1 Tax=Favolaschia claudopus TaxID=2862362 RepID=A0AAW0AU69_9AGAR
MTFFSAFTSISSIFGLSVASSADLVCALYDHEYTPQIGSRVSFPAIPTACIAASKSTTLFFLRFCSCSYLYFTVVKFTYQRYRFSQNSICGEEVGIIERFSPHHLRTSLLVFLLSIFN